MLTVITAVTYGQSIYTPSPFYGGLFIGSPFTKKDTCIERGHVWGDSKSVPTTKYNRVVDSPKVSYLCSVSERWVFNCVRCETDSIAYVEERRIIWSKPKN